VRVADHPVPDPSAEELVDWNAQGFALDVPKREVHGRDRRRNGVPGGKETSPIEQLPKILGAKRVLSQEQRLEMIDCPHHLQLAAGEPRFADALEAFVGVHDHEQVIPLPIPYWECIDAGYLHAYLLVLLTNDVTREG
jgi:hypothetical protein